MARTTPPLSGSGHPPLTSAAPAPDVRGIIREVIREISDAAPPDDRDDIREDVRALEEREKLVAARDRFQALAEERDRTIEQQQETIRHLRSLLADERRRMMALLTGPPVPVVAAVVSVMHGFSGPGRP